MRKWFVFVGVFLLITGCEPKTEAIKIVEKPGAKTLHVRYYKINRHTEKRIFKNALAKINVMRDMHGLDPVAYNETLNMVAKSHAADIMAQGRAWHFGRDGSSPIERTRRAGYQGIFLGEAISETYEGEEKTVLELIKQTSTRNALLAPNAADIGLGHAQEEMGKIWWVVVLGGTGEEQPVSIIPEFSSLNAYLALTAEEKRLYEERMNDLRISDAQVVGQTETVE